MNSIYIRQNSIVIVRYQYLWSIHHFKSYLKHIEEITLFTAYLSFVFIQRLKIYKHSGITITNRIKTSTIKVGDHCNGSFACTMIAIKLQRQQKKLFSTGNDGNHGNERKRIKPPGMCI